MAPKHKDPTREDRRAVAPYNFVSVPDKPVVYPDDDRNPLRLDQSTYHPDRRSGWIDLEIETKSPIYVRGPLTPEQYVKMERQEVDPNDRTPHLQKERNRPDFFHSGDPGRPAIPGSSIRGMLRNLAEILGHGKLQPVSNVPLVYRAVADMSAQGDAYRAMLFQEEPGQSKHYTPRFRGGYIRHYEGSWYIQPAQEIGGTTYARISQRRLSTVSNDLEPVEHLKNTFKIYVQPGPYEFQKVRGGFIHIRYAKAIRAAPHPGAGLIEATLAVSGPMFSKRSEAVIYPPNAEKNNSASWIRIPDGTEEHDQRDLISAYRNQITPEQQKLLGKDGVLKDGQPVLYLMDRDDLVFFGHTQMFRVPYANSPQEMLHLHHSNEDYVDLAEMIFGRVRGEQGGEAGRVFVGDATLLPDQKDPWLESEPVIIPRILSSPKPTTFQHYLTQSQPDAEKGKGLHNYNSSPRQATLRGYKLYWHQGDVSRDDFVDTLSQKEQARDTQHTRIKPVCSGTRFAGRIYFENLHPVELGLLWWTLTLPVEGEYYHKIGMGKPLGLGAIQIRARATFVDPEQRYRKLLESEDRAWEWAGGIVSSDLRDTILEEAVTSFERFITTKTEAGGAFADTPRVRELLAMLSWPGPQPHEEHTRYMEIERADPKAKKGKRNEYRERPVLPTPLNVLERASATPQTTQKRHPKGQQERRRVERDDQAVGVVKVWKGTYGFISPQDGGRDVFVHQGKLPQGINSLQPGQQVRYTAVQGPKGPQATAIELVS